nr:hypothetical protein [Bradyrhizobium sp.]
MSISHAALDNEHAITETIRVHWVLFLVQGIIMMVLGAFDHLAAAFDACRRPLCRLDVPDQRTHRAFHHIRRFERDRIRVVTADGCAFAVPGRAPALASGRRRGIAHAGAHFLLHSEGAFQIAAGTGIAKRSRIPGAGC